MFLTRCNASLDGRFDGFQQLLFVERFAQQGCRPSGHNSFQNDRVAVAGYENDGDGKTRSDHPGLNFPAGKAKHVQIE